MKSIMYEVDEDKDILWITGKAFMTLCYLNQERFDIQDFFTDLSVATILPTS